MGQILAAIDKAVGKQRYPDGANGFKEFSKYYTNAVVQIEEFSETKQRKYDEIKTKDKDATPESFKTENSNASTLGTDVLTFAKDQKFTTVDQFNQFVERIKVCVLSARWGKVIRPTLETEATHYRPIPRYSMP